MHNNVIPNGICSVLFLFFFFLRYIHGRLPIIHSKLSISLYSHIYIYSGGRAHEGIKLCQRNFIYIFLFFSFPSCQQARNLHFVSKSKKNKWFRSFESHKCCVNGNNLDRMRERDRLIN